ncbi:hemoglobin subunit beta-2-like [Spea bombifrons]|uniref:hemoglobin subunit beta-2-like n=1 Tax=Spea bombifrons TaxID=233779 RepID=UPI00234AE6DF|nr:hemoglobin subunit beta-2-like [Spea bombifrons]
MVHFTPEERAAITSMWQKVDMSKDGGDILTRLLVLYPQTRSYFSSFGDLSNETAISENVKVQDYGKKVLGAIGNAIQHLDDVDGSLRQLSDIDTNKVLEDPHNFRLLGKILLIVLDDRQGSAFTPQVQAAWRKFIVVIVAGLTQGYY